MKKVKKLLLLFVLITTSMTVNASSYETVSIGTDYKGKWFWEGEIDSTGAAINSYNKFNMMTGYTSYLFTKPDVSLLRGKLLTGTNLLESTVIHLAGHGTPNYMTFKYNNSTKYETRITTGYNGTDGDGIKCAGLKSYNMNKVKLFIFQGCNTATNNTNIAKIANQLGAKATLGWYDTISTQSNEQWINNFALKIIQPNVSVSAAVSYANSKSYSDSRVKKVNIYGNGNLILVGPGGLPRLNSIRHVNKESSDCETKEYTLNIKATDDNMLNVLENYIEKNINSKFKIENFRVSKISDTLYDLTYVIDGNIRTNMGYTVELTNGNITKIYDNMKKIDPSKINEFKSKSTLSYKSRVSNVLDNYKKAYAIDKTEEFDYYDVDMNTVNHIIRITVRDIKTNALGVYDEIIF